MPSKFLNQQQRDKLLNELSKMNFNRAKGRLRGMDPKSVLAFYRNAQGPNRFYTRYDLPTLGTRVTLIEEPAMPLTPNSGTVRTAFNLVEVIVEPTPENRS